METIVDWLSRLDYVWVGSQLGLLIAVVGYIAWQRRDSNKYHDRRLEIPVPAGAAPEQSGTPDEERGFSWKRTDLGEKSGGEGGRPAFHFRFEGDACRGRALVRDKPVRLIFGQGIATTVLQSISFKGRKFLALFGKEARLAIVIWPGEGLNLDPLGSEAAVARFKDGVLLDEVAFDLFVTKECPEEVPVTAEFFAGGTKLYGLTFSTRVRSAEDEPLAEAASVPPSVVDLDVTGALQDAVGGPNHLAGAGGGDLLLTLELAVGGLMMNLVHTSADAGMVAVGKALNTELDKGSLQTLLAQIRAELGATFYVSDVWNRSSLPPLSSAENEDMTDCFERVASAGSILNMALRAENAEVVRLFDYIERQPAGTRLTIATSKVFLPFEILYPHQYSRDLPPDERSGMSVKRGDFWGAKFGLEVSYVGAGDYLALVRTHRVAPRKVSLNLNETILGTGSPTPMEIHAKLAADLKGRDVACESSSQCDQMRKILLAAGTTANLVYVYCHGSAADPGAGSLEELHLNDGPCVVRPTGVSGQYRNAPIVFLNACYSGATSPMFFTGFLESFRRKGALGLIATSFPVPVMFGAQFGADVVNECVFGTGSLGERVRRLRNSHAVQGNPVPLFYSVQCQLSN